MDSQGTSTDNDTYGYPESETGDESDSTSTLISIPPAPKRSKKLSGAAMYKTRFNPAWIKQYPFLTSVPEDPYRYVVLSCLPKFMI